jgi:Ca2+-transporting ATPase
VDEHLGLSPAEAAARAEQFGLNKFDAGQAEPRWRAFLRQFTDLMQLVLLVSGVVSLLLQEWETGIVLIALTVFNAVLGLQQEGKAAAAVSALQQMMIVKARVIRDGQLQELPAEQLVPGDIVALEAGDIVPADGRLLRAATLEIAESALTGESLPVSKGTEPVEGAGTPLGDRTDMVYMNTNVTRGSGEFVVTATGMATEVGHISGMLQAEQAAKTPLTRQLDKLTHQILWISGFALLVSMALNLARGDTFSAVFTAGVAFAIGAIPENLPAVVTAILASGTQALARVGAIMKRLQSTETLGSTSADPESDDRGPDGGGRPPVRDRRAGLLGRRPHQARSRASRDRYGRVPAADGPGLGRGAQRRRPDRRPHRGRTDRAGRQGRHRRGLHPAGVPADRRAPVRRRLQADGHLPHDDRPVRRRGDPLLRQGRA